MDQYLDKCIESVIAQTYKNFELLLIDDGSTDNSGQICDRYANNYNYIHVIHKNNGGLVTAWKKGVESCNKNSTYILFIDPDDFISEDYLEKLIVPEKNDSDIIISKICKYYLNEKTEKFAFIIKPGFYNKSSIVKLIYPYLINNGGVLDRGLSITRWGKLIKKSLVIKYMNYVDNSITFGEDFNLIIPIFLNAKSITIREIDSATYFYRIRKDSMLRGYDKNMYHSIKKVYKSLTPIINETGNSSLIRQIALDYIGSMLLCYKNNLYNPKGSRIALDFINKLHEDSRLKKYIDEYSINKFNLLEKFILFSIMSNNSLFRILNFYLLKSMSLLKRNRQE